MIRIVPIIILAAFACAREAPGPGLTGPASLDIANAAAPVLVLGYSITHQIANAYIASGGAMVNGTDGGCGTDRWADGKDYCWSTAKQAARNAGLEPRVVWFDISRKEPDTLALRVECVQSVQNIVVQWPTVTTVHISGHVFSGDWHPFYYAPRALETWDAVDRCVAAFPGLAVRGPEMYDETWPREYFDGQGYHLSPLGAEAGAAIVAEYFGQAGESPPPIPLPSSITLQAESKGSPGSWGVRLTWSGATGGTVTILVNGEPYAETPNDGSEGVRLGAVSGTLTFQVCDAAACSNLAEATFTTSQTSGRRKRR